MRMLSSLGSLCLFLALWAPPTVQAQDVGSITGVVTSQAGQPLSGVQVTIPGSARGALTRTDGRYLIAGVPAGQHRVRAALVGYGTAEEAVTLTAGQTATLDFQLADRAVELEEIVAVGYGVQQRRDLTGAVASVSAEEIQQIPTADAVDALRGRVAGVDVVANSRVPGADASIRIRGERSIQAGNEPLLVVDGVPISGPIGDIPVHDIESIEILKDASATAIYGSRGANGVVLITTRSGREGGTRITYDSYVGAQSVINEVPLFNGQEFAEFRREAHRGSGVANPRDEDIFFPVELESIALGRSTDWMSLIRRTGFQQNHNIGVTWGNEATRFATSANWFQHEGVTLGEDFERSTVRLNVEHDASRRFRLGASLQLAHSVQRVGSNVTSEARQNSPLGIPYDDEGNLLFKPTPDGFRVNSLTDLENIQDERTRSRAFGNIFAEFELAEGLTWRGMLGPDVSLGRQGYARGELTRDGSFARIDEDRIFAYTLDNILTYQRALAANHRLNATLLYSIQKERIEDHFSEVSQLPYEHQLFYNLGTAGAIQGVGSNLQEWTLESYMGRVNYSLLDRYLLTLTGRLDGSSRLADGNKYALFPSVAVAWRLSEEPFLRNAPLTELKLRASYGRTGNTAIDPYMTQGAFAVE